jgi:thioredoxin 2
MSPPQTDSVILRCSACGAVNRVPAKRLTQNPLCGKCKALLDFPLKPVQVTSATFEQEVASWPEAMLIVFCSKSLDDCREVGPVVEDIAFFRAGRLKVLKLDIDADPGIALDYTVHITPTLIAFRSGQQLGRLEGVPKEQHEMTQWIRQTLSI